MNTESDSHVLYALGQGIAVIVGERDTATEENTRLEMGLRNAARENAKLQNLQDGLRQTIDTLRADVREGNKRISAVGLDLAKLVQMTNDLETMVAHLQGLMRTRAKGTAARREMLKPVVLQLRSILDFEVTYRQGAVANDEPRQGS